MYFVTFLDKSQFFSKTVPADAGTRLSHAKTKHKTSCGQIQSAAAGTNKHRDISATERSTSNPVLLSRERKPKQAMCRSKLEDNRPNDLLQYAYRTYTLTAIVFRPPQNRCRTADNPALPLLSKRFRQCLLSCLILRLIAQTEAAVVDAAAVCFVFAVGTTGRGLLLWIYFHHRSSFCP